MLECILYFDDINVNICNIIHNELVQIDIINNKLLLKIILLDVEMIQMFHVLNNQMIHYHYHISQ